MTVYPNTPEFDQHIRERLKNYKFSDEAASNIIDAIDTASKSKNNLGIESLHFDEEDFLKKLDKAYISSAKDLYKLIKSPHNLELAKHVLQKYKSNVCKYMVILVSDGGKLDKVEREHLTDYFGSKTRADKLLDFTERVEQNALGERKNVFFERDKQLHNPGQGMSWDEKKIDKVERFLKEQANGTNTSQSNPETATHYVAKTNIIQGNLTDYITIHGINKKHMSPEEKEDILNKMKINIDSNTHDYD